MSLTDLAKNTTVPARISSAIISLVIAVSLFFQLMPQEYTSLAFMFLIFHLSNHLLVGFSESIIPSSRRKE